MPSDFRGFWKGLKTKQSQGGGLLTKPFMLMLATFVVLGISLGGAFAGGVALGKSQDDSSSLTATSPLSAASRQQAVGSAGSGQLGGPGESRQPGQGFAGQGFSERSPEELAQLRQRIQSGDISPEELAQIRQSFQGGNAAGAVNPEQSRELRQQFSERFGQGFGRGGLTGTVESVQGNTVTVSTPDGLRELTVGPDTAMQKSVAANIDDLAEGARIFAISSAEAGGDTRSLVIIPEGQEGGFGGGFFSGGRQGGLPIRPSQP